MMTYYYKYFLLFKQFRTIIFSKCRISKTSLALQTIQQKMKSVTRFLLLKDYPSVLPSLVGVKREKTFNFVSHISKNSLIELSYLWDGWIWLSKICF